MQIIRLDLNSMKQIRNRSVSLIVSIHIPKTAGTTFGLMLQEYHRGHFLYVYNTNINDQLFCIGMTMDELAYNQAHEQETALTLEQVVGIIKKKDIHCIHGHVTYRSVAGFNYYFDRVEYITWIRDPITRSLSDYYHFLRNGYSGEREVLVRHTSNRMIDFIGDNPEVFSFIGRTEHFETDIIRYGIVNSYDSLNISPHYEVDLSLNDLIYAHNQKDIALYQQIVSSMIL